MNISLNNHCWLYLKTISLLIVTYSITSCGNPVTPTGGPKDTASPRITKIKIDSNNNYKIITVDFNENISLKGQIPISPLGKSTNIIKRNSIQIQVPTTTRTIFLKHKITDLNESNPYINSNIFLTTDTGIIQLVNKTKNTKLTVFIKSDSFILLPNNTNNYYQFENLRNNETDIIIINQDNNNYIIDKNEEFLKIKLNSKYIYSTDTIKINHLIPQIRLFQEKAEITNGVTLKIKNIRSYTTNQKIKNILYQNDTCIEYENSKEYQLKPGRTFILINQNDTTYLKEKFSTYNTTVNINSPMVFTATKKPLNERTQNLGKLKLSSLADSSFKYHLYLRNKEYQFLLNITSNDSIYLPVGNYQCLVSLIPFEEIHKDYVEELLLFNYKEEIIINSKLENNLILPKKELFNIGITYK